MALTPGTRIGAYEITAQIGEGGMGQVYRATDTQLKRQVAIKILPPSLAADADRLARFQREAEVLASLNHPHIAAIYGLEDADGVKALVMELVEGEDLSQRIARGAIPIDEALPIAKQIAEALQAAHEQGIIHRDLKPANVKVRSDGTVKVLDFGLAKALEPTGAMSASKSTSPTITTPAMTHAGMILGTAAYMSPEQAKGRPADKRSDVWAFGCVVYEMMTGNRAFSGEGLSDTLAAVLRGEPDWAPLDRVALRSIQMLVRRCLEKDRNKRIAEISTAHFLLGDHGFDRPVNASSRPRTLWPALTIATLLTAAALAIPALRHLREAPADDRSWTASLLPPAGTSFDFAGLALPGISPDGRWVAFGAKSPDGVSQIWLRRLDEATARPLPGSELGYMPFWSPDSRYVGFGIENRLVKADINGGPPVTLTKLTASLRGASWSPEGVILYAVNSTTTPVFRISSSGGESRPATSIDKEQEPRGHRAPWFLPDGRHFLYTAPKDGDMPVRLGMLDGPAEPGRIVATAHSPAFYAQGYLTYLRDGTLMAQPFDVTRLMTTGEAVPVAEQIPTFLAPVRWPVFAVSPSGVLVYQSGGVVAASTLAWRDRDGKILSTIADGGGEIREIQLSPKGESLAASIIDAAGLRSLWVYDLGQGVRRRFTFDPSNNYSPVWSPDGGTIFWRSPRAGAGDLYRKAADGAGSDELLLNSAMIKTPTSVSADGRNLLFTEFGAESVDLWVLPLTPETGGAAAPARPFLQTRADEGLGQFSPDGSWVLYVSSETGENEVYVAPFAGGGGKRQISTGGGVSPRWRRDGNEVFYVTKSGQLMAVEVTRRGNTVDVGRARSLFEGVITGGGYLYDTTRGYQYDVSADGEKFIVAQHSANGAPPLTIVRNWTAGLKK